MSENGEDHALIGAHSECADALLEIARAMAWRDNAEHRAQATDDAIGYLFRAFRRLAELRPEQAAESARVLHHVLTKERGQ